MAEKIPTTEADAGQRWQLTAQGVIAEGTHIYVYPAEGGEALARAVGRALASGTSMTPVTSDLS